MLLYCSSFDSQIPIFNFSRQTFSRFEVSKTCSKVVFCGKFHGRIRKPPLERNAGGSRRARGFSMITCKAARSTNSTPQTKSWVRPQCVMCERWVASGRSFVQHTKSVCLITFTQNTRKLCINRAKTVHASACCCSDSHGCPAGE